jgi:hypothetical protein
MSEVVCDYCQKPAQLVGGSVLYPYRPEKDKRKYWACLPCKAWIAVKPNGKPVGRLANAELRRLKVTLHGLFDPYWRGQQMPRRTAYRWLSKMIGLDREKHIGQFTDNECIRAINFLKSRHERS